jgi:hypothetical protein
VPISFYGRWGGLGVMALFTDDEELSVLASKSLERIKNMTERLLEIVGFEESLELGGGS